MDLTRRKFVQLASAATAGLAAVPVFSGLGRAAVSKPEKRARQLSPKWTTQTTSICAFCSVGCGLLVNTDTQTRRAVNVEGDPDHPINQGALCAKGAATIQMTENDKRTTTCLYREPYGDTFVEKDWDWCKKRIARLIKKSRDESFEAKNDKGQTVNRTMGIASMGSAAIDNEECLAMQSFMRSLGLVYIEHQARI
jgi:formate dehydrogenase major subunit